jgi:hypothetical protein
MDWLDHMLDPAVGNGEPQAKKAAPLDRVQIQIARGQLHAYKGEMAKAIEQWETAYRMAAVGRPTDAAHAGGVPRNTAPACGGDG